MLLARLGRVGVLRDVEATKHQDRLLASEAADGRQRRAELQPGTASISSCAWCPPDDALRMNAPHAAAAAKALVAAAVDDLADTDLPQGRGTHQAGLDRHVERHVAKPSGFIRRYGRARGERRRGRRREEGGHGLELGVQGRVAQLVGPIPSRRDHLAVADEDAADRNLGRLEGLVRLGGWARSLNAESRTMSIARSMKKRSSSDCSSPGLDQRGPQAERRPTRDQDRLERDTVGVGEDVGVERVHCMGRAGTRVDSRLKTSAARHEEREINRQILRGTDGLSPRSLAASRSRMHIGYTEHNTGRAQENRRIDETASDQTS